jgi:tRNA(His) guanylyltransferase
MRDDLGNRMKENYENRTRLYLPRRTYTVIRVDGKAFHSYTKNLNKPFDLDLIEDMDSAVSAALPQIQGVKFAYVQSDEISFLLTDFELPKTCAWFDGNVQKICSVSASLMTGEFNRFRARRWAASRRAIMFMGSHMEEEANDNADLSPFNLGCFDSRVFTIPDPTEVYNYFVWRNQDAARNSISMVAQSLYSHKELQHKDGAEMQEMIFKKGINWATYDPSLKNGRLIYKKSNGERSETVVEPAWVFTQNPALLKQMIPKYE